MQIGLLFLGFGYVLSQFFRAFLAVLSAPLKSELGIGPDALAYASAIWFVVFAAMQIPVGSALDRIGPRRVAAGLLFVGGCGGALVFASATTATHINIAMALIGIGCSPVLMASYFIFAREFSPARFATLAALMLGLGSVGNLFASYPMAAATEAIGWRAAMVVLAAMSALVASGVLMTVRDPARLEDANKGSVLDLLRMPALWFIFPLMFVNYAPAGAIRGAWIGPYLGDVYQLDTVQISWATLIMGTAMIAGTLAVGPLDRVFGTRKWIIFVGNALCAAATLTLAALIDAGPVLSIALMAAIGFFGATFPVILAHARAFFPSHLAGRGVTLINLFGIGGVGIMQFASGRVHTATSAAGTAVPFSYVFAFFGIALALGCVIYAFSTDRTD